MRYRLQVIEGPVKGASFSLRPSSTTLIGRAPTCDVYLTDKNASRFHCEIRVWEEHCSIEDLKSENGTTVNDKRIDKTELSVGDTIQIGSTVVRLVQDEGEGSEEQTRHLIEAPDDPKDA